MAVKKYIILASILTFSVTAKADDVPNTFEAGEPIVASDVNENFVDLQNQINALKAQLEAQNSNETTIEFVGITASTTSGNIGGHFNANRMCDDIFPGAKMCTFDEAKYINPSLVSERIWIEGVNDTEYPFQRNCYDYTKGESFYEGTAFTTNGRRESTSCIQQLKVACCK